MANSILYKTQKKWCFLSMLPLFVLWWIGVLGNSASFIQKTQNQEVISFDQSKVQLNQDIHFYHVVQAQFSYRPYQSPYLPNSTPAELQNSDENDLNEEREIHGDYFYANSNHHSVFIAKSSGLTIDNLAQILANQQKVSLIIFHHSWKSFLI